VEQRGIGRAPFSASQAAPSSTHLPTPSLCVRSVHGRKLHLVRRGLRHHVRGVLERLCRCQRPVFALPGVVRHVLQCHNLRGLPSAPAAHLV
jgi:hypothetical protein